MADTAESNAASLAEQETDDSVTELLERLAREVSGLVLSETRLAASRHRRELRRAARDVAAAVAVGLAFLTAFVLANAAAVRAISAALPGWLAPLVLAAAWVAAGLLLVLFLRSRARRLGGRDVTDAEAGRAEAERAVRQTLERLSPAISKEIALAAVPVAGEMASGVVDAGEEILESADELVEKIADDVPGGGVANQMWDVVLMPGRLGVRVATTVLKRTGAS